MPNWWFRIPRWGRVTVALIVLWQTLLFLSAFLTYLVHPYP